MSDCMWSVYLGPELTNNRLEVSLEGGQTC